MTKMSSVTEGDSDASKSTSEMESSLCLTTSDVISSQPTEDTIEVPSKGRCLSQSDVRVDKSLPHDDNVQSARSGKSKLSLFSDVLPPADKWYEQQCFQRYWQHYHFVSVWRQKHLELYRYVDL